MDILALALDLCCCFGLRYNSDFLNQAVAREHGDDENVLPWKRF